MGYMGGREGERGVEWGISRLVLVGGQDGGANASTIQRG